MRRSVESTLAASLRSALVVPALLVPALFGNAASARDLEPRELFAPPEISDVSVSPSGEWVVGVAQYEGEWGILVQRRGEGAIVPVYGSEHAIWSLAWIGDDALLVGHSAWDAVKSAALRFRLEDGQIAVDSLQIRQFGWLVAPLVDEEEIVLWARTLGGNDVVRRGPISALAFGRKWKTAGRWVEGDLETVAELPDPVTHWIADRAGVVRAALTSEGSRDPVPVLRYRRSPEDGWDEVWKGERDDEAVIPVGITADGRRLIVTAYGDHDTRGLYELDPDSGRLVREVFRHETFDVVDATFDYNGIDLVAAVYRESGELRQYYLNGFAAASLRGRREIAPDATVLTTSSSRDHRFLTLYAFSARDPGTFYFYEKESGRLEKLGRVNSRISPDQLVAMRAFDVVSADGSKIEAFLALPDRADEGPPPLLVYPHGGPIGVQDDRSFDPFVQFVANAGIAVLKVNYRGSLGYGKAFLAAGAREWGRGIEDDVDAAVRRVLDEGLVDPQRICIAGGSYGGYSALVSAIRWPDRYRCVVTINGVTDLPLIVGNRWEIPAVREWYLEHVGDPATDFDQMMEVSPAYHTERLEAPVLIIQGARDENVDPDHAYRLRAMMEVHGKPYEWLELARMRHSPDRAQWQRIARAVRWFVRCHLGDMPANRRVSWAELPCDPVETAASTH